MADSRQQMRLQRDLVLEVMNELGKIADQLIDEVEEPIRVMEQALGPDVWVGYGADAFAQEVETVEIPNTNHIKETCLIIKNCVQKATDIIDRGDTNASSVLDQAADSLSQIYG